MAKKHTPTAAMVSASKRGLQLIKDGKVSESDVPDISLKSGRKIAAGQQISDDHVRSMSLYHTSHFPQFSGTTLMSGGCPSGDDSEHCDDLMWGGPAGASWAASRVAAMDATDLADDEDAPDLATLLSGGNGFSMEIFTRADLLDRVDLAKDADGLIWAPIIRSGTLAMRPDGKGGKKAEPLVFVKGHAVDSNKEIGLQDLLEAFEDQAVEHVTIPKTHANDTLENTGAIVKMKIVDSTLVPGEKVILGGHKFTEPDVEGKVERGSILSRSCGILHNYTNTETGRTYPHVVEHVALTNRPWVTKMEPYGSDCFSEGREVVPMLLSQELTIEPPKIDPKAPRKPIFSTRDPIENLGLELADVQWGDEPSLRQIQTQLYETLRGLGRSPDYDEGNVYFDVMDVTPTKALVQCDYGDVQGDMDAWVIPFAVDDQGNLSLADFAEWKPVEQKWVTDDDADQDKQEIADILGNTQLSDDDRGELRIYLSVSQSERDKAHTEGNSLPDKSYPINNKKQLRSAAVLAASGHGDAKAAKALIRRRAKDLGVDVKTLPGFGDDSGDGKKKTSSKTDMSLSTDPVKRASELRLSTEQPNNQQSGGTQMGLTPEVLERLNLDATGKEVLQREMAEQATKDAELERYRTKDRAKGVTERIEKLKAMGFSDCPGFLTYIERTLLSDNGDAAIRLDLADGTSPTIKTITDVIDGLIGALPLADDGKVNLAAKGNLLNNPLDRRPDLEPEKEGDEDKPLTGEQLAEQWRKAAPEAMTTLSLAPVGGKEQ